MIFGVSTSTSSLADSVTQLQRTSKPCFEYDKNIAVIINVMSSDKAVCMCIHMTCFKYGRTEFSIFFYSLWLLGIISVAKTAMEADLLYFLVGSCLILYFFETGNIFPHSYYSTLLQNGEAIYRGAEKLLSAQCMGEKHRPMNSKQRWKASFIMSRATAWFKRCLLPVAIPVCCASSTYQSSIVDLFSTDRHVGPMKMCFLNLIYHNIIMSEGGFSLHNWLRLSDTFHIIFSYKNTQTPQAIPSFRWPGNILLHMTS